MLFQVQLNLVNSPLIDYSLDWLERCEIDETILYCKAQPHADAIREHCRLVISYIIKFIIINIIDNATNDLEIYC